MTLLENQRPADTDVVNSGVNDDDPIVGGEIDHEHSGDSVGMSGKLNRMDVDVAGHTPAPGWWIFTWSVG
jgi:hypothetical protein